MSQPSIRIAVRSWDGLAPIALGDVAAESFDLEVVRVDTTPDLAERMDLDGVEGSGSRAVLDFVTGDRSCVAVPIFVLCDFRQRCVWVRKNSDLVDFSQLVGRRVGLTGWPDTGNTWTRALVRAAGVGLDAIEWCVGPLNTGEPVFDRIGVQGAPANVVAAPAGVSLTDMLLAGSVDVVMTPSAPAGAYDTESPIRRLLPNYRAAELEYFQKVGLVPGIHLIKLRRATAERFPTVVSELMPLFRRAHQAWQDRCVMLADTQPWLIRDPGAMAGVAGLDWTPFEMGTAVSSAAALCDELAAQGLTEHAVQPRDVFADYFELTGSAAESVALVGHDER